MTKPTAEQIKTAQILLRFAARPSGAITIEICREVIEHLAENEFFEQTADWKNAMLFELTGIQAICNYREEARYAANH